MTHQRSIDLRAIGFVNDGPAAKDHPKPVPWTWLYSFLAYVLIFAGIGGVVFVLAEMGGI